MYWPAERNRQCPSDLGRGEHLAHDLRTTYHDLSVYLFLCAEPTRKHAPALAMSVSSALPNEALTNILGYRDLCGLALSFLVPRSWKTSAHSLPNASPKQKTTKNHRTLVEELVLNEEFKDFGDEDYILE